MAVAFFGGDDMYNYKSKKIKINKQHRLVTYNEHQLLFPFIRTVNFMLSDILWKILFYI